MTAILAFTVCATSFISQRSLLDHMYVEPEATRLMLRRDSGRREMVPVPHSRRLELVTLEALDTASVLGLCFLDAPVQAADSCWVEVQFGRAQGALWDNDAVAAAYVQLSGTARSALLQGRVSSGAALIWHKGKGLNQARLWISRTGLYVRIGDLPAGTVIGSVEVHWYPKLQNRWKAPEFPQTIVANAARATPYGSYFVNDFVGLASKELTRK